MRKALAEDQLAEVMVIRDEDALLRLGDLENLTVRQGVGVVVGDGGHVMTLLSKKSGNAELGTLVKEKLHTFAGGNTPRGCLSRCFCMRS